MATLPNGPRTQIFLKSPTEKPLPYPGTLCLHSMRQVVRWSCARCTDAPRPGEQSERISTNRASTGETATSSGDDAVRIRPDMSAEFQTLLDRARQDVAIIGAEHNVGDVAGYVREEPRFCCPEPKSVIPHTLPFQGFIRR